MAAGLGQCMYCGESRGTSVDHFEPITRAPQRAFDWLNHLLACSHCNSNEKREQYPCDASGCCLLVDPSQQDPRDHLWLRLTTGCYEPRSVTGAETIKVFGLNRELLPRGRLAAFHVRRAVLRDALARCAADEQEEMAVCLRALAEQPFADVLYAMVDAAERPGAVEVLGRDVVEMLKRPEVLRLVWPH
ncbi:HNH endonuclease [Spirillospora sp. NPDC052269]